MIATRSLSDRFNYFHFPRAWLGNRQRLVGPWGSLRLPAVGYSRLSAQALQYTHLARPTRKTPGGETLLGDGVRAGVSINNSVGASQAFEGTFSAFSWRLSTVSLVSGVLHWSYAIQETVVLRRYEVLPCSMQRRPEGISLSTTEIAQVHLPRHIARTGEGYYPSCQMLDVFRACVR